MSRVSRVETEAKSQRGARERERERERRETGGASFLDQEGEGRGERGDTPGGRPSFIFVFNMSTVTLKTFLSKGFFSE